MSRSKSEDSIEIWRNEVAAYTGMVTAPLITTTPPDGADPNPASSPDVSSSPSSAQRRSSLLSKIRISKYVTGSVISLAKGAEGKEVERTGMYGCGGDGAAEELGESTRAGTGRAVKEEVRRGGRGVGRVNRGGKREGEGNEVRMGTMGVALGTVGLEIDSQSGSEGESGSDGTEEERRKERSRERTERLERAARLLGKR